MEQPQPRIEETFQQVMTPPAKKPFFLEKHLSSSWFWGLITTIVLFLFLYITNPPIVQQSRSSANSLTRPPVNVTLVLIWSLVGGLIVFAFPFCSQWMMHGE